ncbi:MAG: DNA polymerase III subunit delta [Bacillota bacterium]|nr:DNA polymerase III subunit delta [Clostridia bacterium]
MEEISVLNDINRGVISLVYLFYGQERFLLERTLDKLTKFLTSGGTGDFNYEKLDGTGVSPAQVAAAANVLPVFAEKRLVVVANSPWFGNGKVKEDDPEPLLSYLNNPSPYTCLVFICGEKIDSKRKTVKAVKKVGRIIEFTSPKGVELNRWIEKRFQVRGKKAVPRVADYLAMAVGNDLSSLEQEIEKTALYVGAEAEVTLEDVKKTVCSTSNLTVFNLTDAVSRRDSALGVLYMRELVRNGEHELKVLSLLATQMRNLLKIHVLSKKGMGEKEIAAAAGIHPYIVKKGRQQCGNFSQEELIQALEILLDVDVKFKTGKGELLPLLETAILKMCQR